METVCKNKKMADSLLAAVELHTTSKTAQAAIRAVREYVDRNCQDIPEDPEERRKLIEEIERELALADDKDIQKLVRLHCDLLPDDEPNFNVVILPAGSDSMLKKEGEE